MQNCRQICVFWQNPLHATDFQEFPVGHWKSNKDLYSICVLGHSLTDSINATPSVGNSTISDIITGTIAQNAQPTPLHPFQCCSNGK